MNIFSSNSLEKAIAFLKSHLRKNKFFLKIENESIIKFSGSKRGNKVYAHLTEQKIKPIIDLLVKSENAYFLTLTHSYDQKNPIESWTFFRKELPKFLRKCKIKNYLYVYEAHKNGGCHCHLIVNGEVSIDKIKRLWNGHIKIKKISSQKIGAYLTKEIGKAGHVESALKNYDAGKLKDKDIKKIWRFFYLIKLGMRGWGTCRNLKIKESVTPESETVESENSDLISIMNNSTEEKPNDKTIIISLPKKIIRNPIFRPYCEKITDKSTDWFIIKEFLNSLNAIKKIKNIIKPI
jgi:hypothetical protein